MISISSFQAAEQAKNYYAKENYYLKGGDVGKFSGKLSFLLSSSSFEKDYFKLLHGINPVTNKKITKQAGRAGFDVTFSAPKSFSLVFETLRANNKNDEAEQLLNAHRAAVNKVMQKVEQYLKTRIRDENNNLIKINVIGGIWASFEHDISRMSESGEIDPQVHTHNFIFNIVAYQNENGQLKYGTVENFDVFKNKMFLGQLYRSELAKQLKNFGYKIEITDVKNGFFEIKGFTKKQIDAFSNRSSEIKSYVEEYKQKYKNIKNESALKNIINQDIKKAKKEIDRTSILERNKHRMEQLGITLDFVLQLKSNKLNKKEISTKQALEFAAKTLTEHQSVFTKEELLKEALKISIGDIGLEELEKELIENDFIVELQHNYYTTKEILKAEQYVINNISIKDKSINDNVNLIQNFIKTNYNSMTDDQKQMLQGILTADNRFIVVQGDAGTGKTYSLKALKEFVYKYNPGIELVGLSFTGKAAAGLEADSGIKSTTIHSFLAKEAKNNELNKRKKVLIIDEAGLVGSLQYAQLVELAKKKDYKVIFIGDVKQFAPVAAGNLFKEIQNKTTTIKLSQTLRQKSNFTKALVKNFKEKNFDFVFELLQEHKKIKEDDDKENLINSIVEHYFQNNENLLIIASKNEDKNKINQLIRAKKTFKNEKTFKVKESINIPAVAKYLSSSYLVDNYILEIGGKQFKVTKAKDKYTLIVKNIDSGKEKEIDLFKYANKINVFIEKEKNFAVGDKVIFTKNSKEFKNGEIATITNIKDNLIYLDSGKVIDTNKYKYFDYGYAITDYKAQGVTADNVAVLADSKIATYNSFYTQITRAKYDVTIYTYDSEMLFNKMLSFVDKKVTLDFKLNKKGENYDTKRDVSKNYGKSTDNYESIRENRTAIREARKERFRFKKLIHRATERVKQFVTRILKTKVKEKVEEQEL